MKYRLKELASLCGGELLGADATVMRVSTDSRTLSMRKPTRWRDSSAAPTRSKRCKSWPPITGPA